jgi:hypothetical protein
MGLFSALISTVNTQHAFQVEIYAQWKSSRLYKVDKKILKGTDGQLEAFPPPASSPDLRRSRKVANIFDNATAPGHT